MERITLKVNGLARHVVVDSEQLLADVLRKQLLLTGCKTTCMEGQCGACSVILNGKVVRSCLVRMKKVPNDSEVQTIEGLAKSVEDLHPLQVAWMAHGGAQCGIRTPGFLMSAKGLLDQNQVKSLVACLPLYLSGSFSATISS